MILHYGHPTDGYIPTQEEADRDQDDHDRYNDPRKRK